MDKNHKNFWHRTESCVMPLNKSGMKNQPNKQLMAAEMSLCADDTPIQLYNNDLSVHLSVHDLLMMKTRVNICVYTSDLSVCEHAWEFTVALPATLTSYENIIHGCTLITKSWLPPNNKKKISAQCQCWAGWLRVRINKWGYLKQ